jgi:hypothetical protein
LGRKDRLKLSDIAREAGWYTDREHNAFNDAWATAWVFSYLKALE